MFQKSEQADNTANNDQINNLDRVRMRGKQQLDNIYQKVRNRLIIAKNYQLHRTDLVAEDNILNVGYVAFCLTTRKKIVKLTLYICSTFTGQMLPMFKPYRPLRPIRKENSVPQSGLTLNVEQVSIRVNIIRALNVPTKTSTKTKYPDSRHLFK